MEDDQHRQLAVLACLVFGTEKQTKEEKNMGKILAETTVCPVCQHKSFSLGFGFRPSW